MNDLIFVGTMIVFWLASFALVSGFQALKEE